MGTEGDDATSIPEDKHVTSQRFNDSASVIDTAGMTDQTVTAGGIPANLESGPLTSFTVDNEGEETANAKKTQQNAEDNSYSYDSDSYTRTQSKNSDTESYSTATHTQTEKTAS